MIGAVVFLVAVIVIFAVVISGMAGVGAPGEFLIFPGLMLFLFILLVIVGVATSAGGFGRRSLPPPPPIQQPMVPAGMQGPVALNCPNCGAPPGAIDRFGVATCTHCATRFLVR